MAKKYDLVVVGGGPAGLMAARVAGENGLKTALLERKTDMTKVRRVDGGILSPVNEYTFGEILTFNPEAKKIGFPVKEEFRFGVSDANLVAEQGIPVIDGLGPCGARDHSKDEFMIKESLLQRSALLTASIVKTWKTLQPNC